MFHLSVGCVLHIEMAAPRQRRQTAIVATNILFNEVPVDASDDIDESDADENDAILSEKEDSDNSEVDTEVSDEGDILPLAARIQQHNPEKFKSPDGIQWSSTPVIPARGRQPLHNIVREMSGPNRDVSERAVSPQSTFMSFITPEIVGIIVKCTNEEGNRVFDIWNETTPNEIYTYLGLIILAGVYRGRFEPIIHLWNVENGRSIFGQAMSRDRFQALTRVMRFDDKNTRVERRERDKMAPIRDVTDKFVTRCRVLYKPGFQVCVDEQLVVYRGRCPFKVYIPSKPGKYGLKVWACADVKTSYVSNLELYTGRQGRGPEVGQPTRVVLQMTSPIAGSGRGCTGDNFFSSLTLTQSLLTQKITYCGTVRKNRRFLPPAILETKGREVKSSVFAFTEDITLVSYIPKKQKNVILMSSQHHNNEVHEAREDRKPEIILHYNKTKGAVDTADQLIRTYSCQRKSRRWPMIFFQHLVDTAALNSSVIFFSLHPNYNTGKPQRRRLFLEQLAKNLIAPAIAARRPAAPPRVIDVPARVYRDDANNPRKRKRCDRCPRASDKKTTETCSACNKAICKQHLRIVCDPSCE